MIICLPIVGYSQPGAVDMTFDPGIRADSTIYAVVFQADGKILIGGGFETYNGKQRPFLARLLEDGSLDTTFITGAGPNRIVFQIAIQPDNKILVTGDLTTFNGDSIYKMIRLMPDGTVDTTFKADRIHSRAKQIIVQPDNKILIAGSFATVNWLPYTNLARLHSDGKLDTTFNTLNALNGTVEAMQLQPDGKVLIGGSFTQYAGVQGYRIARVKTDGSVDSTFNPGIGGAGSNTYGLKLLPNGKILLGGEFSFYNGSTVGYVVRTNNDGTIDFTYPQNPGANLPVYDVIRLANGNYMFGGDFSSYNGIAAPKIVTVDTNGIIDPQFNAGTGADKVIEKIVIDNKNRIMVIGKFTTFNGISRNRIVRLYNCLSQQPDSIYGLSYAECNGTTQTYYVTPVVDAVRYEWTLPNGWTGTSDSAFITAISDGSGGVISVRAFSDSCGYSYATSRNIATVQPPSVDICLVTVNNSSTHNIVIWEKPESTLIDSFFIYRETTTNVYTKIGAVPYDSLSEYHDLDTNANPNSTSFRYKLSVLDTCGAESALSPFHNTIHLQNLGNGNFQWTFYQIETAPNPVTSFNMNRDALGNGNFFPIGLIPGTNATFTDLNASSFPNAVYVVDVNWGINCDPSRRVNTTRSNIRRLSNVDTSLLLGILTEFPENTVHVYPNPAQHTFYIIASAPLNAQRLVLYNPLGQELWSRNNVELNKHNPSKVSVESLPDGVYLLVIETDKERLWQKVVLHRP